MTVEDALRWVARLFEQPPESVSPETSRDSLPLWDSLGVLTLMAEMDEKFGVLLTDQEMRSMSKVGDILEVLRQHGKLD